eukprot:sb/3465139/
MKTGNTSTNTTEDTPECPEDNYDMLIGSLYIFGMVFGIPANLTSFIYFVTRKLNKTPSNNSYIIQLYRLVTATDVVICFLSLPVLISAFDSRESDWFDNQIFCTIWGLLWAIAPLISVLLVTILSVSRTLILVYPIKILRLKVPLIILAGVVLALTTANITVSELVQDDIKYNFNKAIMMCYLNNSTKNFEKNEGIYNCKSKEKGPRPGKEKMSLSDYEQYQLWQYLLIYGIPFVVVIISTLISLKKLWEAGRNTKQLRAAAGDHGNHSNDTNTSTVTKSNPTAVKKKIIPANEATLTIILVTLLYMFCNFWVILVYAFFVYKFGTSCRPGSKGCTEEDIRDHSKFVQFYLWTLSVVGFVVLNSTLNPVLYYYRMDNFRKFVKEVLFRMRRIQTTERDSDQVVPDQTQVNSQF